MQKEYKIIAAYSLVDLETDVVRLLNEGWGLVGGMATRTGNHGEGVYYQTLYKGPLTSFYI